MDSIRRIVRALRTMNAGPGHASVTAAQLFVLRQVAASPGLSLAELSRRTLTGASAASEVVSRLVAAGLVERRNGHDDNRRAAFSLTVAGEAIARNARVSVQERLLDAFGRMSPAEQSSLARTLQAWVASADLGQTPATMFFEPETPAG